MGSLVSKLFSLFCLYEFPVQTLATIRRKYRSVGAYLDENECPPKAQFREFPCIFPC